MSEKIISHSATIVQIDGTTAKANLDNVTSCPGCALSGSCGSSSQGNVTLQVTEAQAVLLHPGTRVTVVARNQKKWNSVLLLFLVPISVMIVAALTAILFGGSQNIAAIVSVAAIAIWFIILKTYGTSDRKHIWQITEIKQPE